MRAWIWAISPAHLSPFLQMGTFAVHRVGRKAVARMAPGDLVFVYLTGTKAIAGMVEVVSTPFEDDTPLVPGGAYRHRVRIRPRAVLAPGDYVPYAAFAGDLEVAREYGGLFRRVVQQVAHPLPKLDEKVLAFLVRARQATDLDTVLAAYDAYLRVRTEPPESASAPAASLRVAEPPEDYRPERAPEPKDATEAESRATPDVADFDRAEATEVVIAALAARGYVYAPWQVAAYLAAVRTKPFVILAGVTGTGKSRLPALIAEATGGAAHVVPVRPDWSDAGEVLGYTDLHGRFRPGILLRLAHRAATDPARQHAAIFDEMNVARVEHYFADVLSRIEQRGARRGAQSGSAPPLLAPGQAAAPWDAIALPRNLALVGTVNVDESAHAFSRRVLDRAFVLELAEVDLSQGLAPPASAPIPAPWPAAVWQPRGLRLAEILPSLDAAERERAEQTVAALAEANRFLAPAGLHVAYRVRDEVAAFVLHASETLSSFRDADGALVDPLDLALLMKVLPRLEGGGRVLRRALEGLLAWAAGEQTDGSAGDPADAAQDLAGRWEETGRGATLPGARFPRTAARLAHLYDQLRADGYAAFWR